MCQMKTQSLLLLNSWRFVYNIIKNYLILFSNIDIVFPIARNWLYSARRPEKIMSALESVGSQDSARENLSSKTNHWAEQSVLPVFL